MIKCYKTIVDDVDLDTSGLIDILISKEVIGLEDNDELRAETNTKQEKTRRLLRKIVRKNISSAYPIFLKALKEDNCYHDCVIKLEKTDATDIDIRLLNIGMLSNSIPKQLQ